MKRALAYFVIIAVSAAAQAQGTGSTTPAVPAQARPAMPQQVGAAHPESVGPAEAVITVHGLCPENSGKGSAACSTVITKEQFEKIVAAVNQAGAPMPPAAVRSLAERYVQMLAFAQQAEKLGIDKDPKFQELMRVVRLNSLSEAYHRALAEKYRNSPDAEIQAYYDKNISKFEQVKLGRVFIPRINPKAPHEGLDDFEQRAQKVASEMRERAAKGENLDKLQQEAYKTLGLASPSINTDAGTRRRGGFPPNVENDIFSLKPGEVTKVEPEPAGFQFYKLEGRDTLTLAQVKNEIVAAVHKEQLDSANKAVLDPIHTDLNETYFGPRPAGMPLMVPPPRSPAAAGGVLLPPSKAAGPSSTQSPASPK